MHSQRAFDDERATWKPVILLNILNTVRNILTVIKEDTSLSSGKHGTLEPALLARVNAVSPELLSCEDRLIQILLNSGHIQTGPEDTPGGASSKAVYLRRKALNGGGRTSVEMTRKLLSAEDSSAWESIAGLVNSHKDDIMKLWREPLVQYIVKERLQEDWRG